MKNKIIALFLAFLLAAGTLTGCAASKTTAAIESPSQAADDAAPLQIVTTIFLADKTDELGLPAVLTIEGADHRIAETIVDNTLTKDQAILTMDSMQSATAADAAAGTTYLSIMEKNLDVLTEALG